MTDPTRRSLALAAARTSDAGANLRARVAELGHTIWAARTAGVSIPDTTREIVHGRARARRHRALNRILPSIRLADHSAEVIATARANGFTDVRVFGSCVHGTDTPASDVDLIVTTSEHASLLDFVRFTDAVEDLLSLARGRVDVFDDEALRPGSDRGDRIAAEMQPLADWAAGQPARMGRRRDGGGARSGGREWVAPVGERPPRHSAICPRGGPPARRWLTRRSSSGLRRCSLPMPPESPAGVITTQRLPAR